MGACCAGEGEGDAAEPASGGGGSLADRLIIRRPMTTDFNSSTCMFTLHEESVSSDCSR